VDGGVKDTGEGKILYYNFSLIRRNALSPDENLEMHVAAADVHTANTF